MSIRSRGSAGTASTRPGAELFINAHQYTYERFAPQTPDGATDPTRGIRRFIVVTGGHRHDAIGKVRVNSEVRNNTDYGVLKLSLEANGYSWQFIGVGGTVLDSGSGTYH